MNGVLLSLQYNYICFVLHKIKLTVSQIKPLKIDMGGKIMAEVRVIYVEENTKVSLSNVQYRLSIQNLLNSHPV